jgi:hypothetical protein
MLPNMSWYPINSYIYYDEEDQSCRDWLVWLMTLKGLSWLEGECDVVTMTRAIYALSWSWHSSDNTW